MHGSEAWKRPISNGDRMKAALRSPDFMKAWLVPLVVYLFLLILYSCVFMQAPAICTFSSTMAAGYTLWCSFNRSKGPAMFPLSLSLLVATVVGTLFGLYCYDSFAVFPRFYANARTYDNVVASEPAAAVRDAGKVVFTSESYVSIKESTGYVTESGYTYCVAPIRDNKGMKTIEFWAAGIGCCEGQGSFTCDAAGSKEAHAGAVVFDNGGIFQPTRHSLYEKARAKAMAEFGLLSAAEPLYVRWVENADLDILSRYYKTQAVLFVVTTAVLFAVGSAVLALLTVPISIIEGPQGKRP